MYFYRVLSNVYGVRYGNLPLILPRLTLDRNPLFSAQPKYILKLFPISFFEYCFNSRPQEAFTLSFRHDVRSCTNIISLIR